MESLRLNEQELRVLGCLIEKQLATPAYYPLSLNSLASACNQKSNRDPVVSFSEQEVERALSALRDKGLAARIRSADSRVDKYGHQVGDVLDISLQETAIMAELMLRGPQTPGELKQRASRMVMLNSLEEVHAALDSLIAQGLVLRHERQPGRKENRYSHLMGLAGPPAETVQASPVRPPGAEGGLEARVARLEQEVERLARELDIIRRPQ